MAKEKVKQEAKEAQPEEAEEAPKKKKGGLLKLLIPLILLGGGGAGAAWYFTQSGDKAHNKAKAEKQQEAPPVYERLETFTVNLAGGENFLQVEISLKVADAKMGEAIKQRMPEVRDGVLRLLSSKQADELKSPEGKVKLSEDVRKLVNQMLNMQEPGQGVLGVLFTSFVIQ